MGKAEKISIIIPAYNEQDAIGSVLEKCLELIRSGEFTNLGLDAEVMVIDDGSDDKTAEIVSGFSEVRLIRHPRNLGYGAALKTGVAKAKGDLVAFLDADGTNPPSFLPSLVDKLATENAHIVIASRMSSNSKMPSVRKMGNKFFATLLSWLTTTRITDAASGQRVFRKDAIPWFRELPDGLHLTPAMSTRALHEGLKIVEVPAPYEQRTGESKLSAVWDGWRFLAIILGTASRYNPLKLLGLGGTILLVLAILLGIEPVLLFVKTGTEPDWMIYRLATIEALLVLGTSMIFLGMYGNTLFSVLYGRPPHRNSMWGSLLLRPGPVKATGWIGLILVLCAVLVNWKPLIGYLQTGIVLGHWLKPVVGMGLVLLGMLLILFSIILRLLLTAVPGGYVSKRPEDDRD
ncbi:MAG: glycosyltransferase family 2 protein [Deltaproteobacteria bacterium]|nr:glycosyltransferase family 2 protein [Deltaproteobacteria bacterium]